MPDFQQAWPGHREPISDPAGRAEEIIDHHEERAYRGVELLDEEGPLSTWEVSDRLFGELTDVHILHGPGEAHAHLDHLVREGLLAETDDGYLLRPETISRLDELDGRKWPLRSLR